MEKIKEDFSEEVTSNEGPKGTQLDRGMQNKDSNTKA